MNPRDDDYPVPPGWCETPCHYDQGLSVVHHDEDTIWFEGAKQDIALYCDLLGLYLNESNEIMQPPGNRVGSIRFVRQYVCPVTHKVFPEIWEMGIPIALTGIDH